MRETSIELWIPVTIAAAFLQNLRSALQKRLLVRLSVNGATYCRFIYAAPFALAYPLLLTLGPETTLPMPNVRFVLFAAAGGVSQAVGTALLVYLFSLRNFATGVAYSKTEVVQTAMFSLVILGEMVNTTGAVAIAVSLVGVVLADTGLNLPDFRAGERAFQLLCQVSGRAGRGPRPGSVIVQTYDPTHYAVKAAAAQDYQAFYDRELEFRRDQGNPPFHRLVRMVYTHTVPEACRREAERMGRALRRRMHARGRADLDLIGPAPQRSPPIGSIISQLCEIHGLPAA